MHKSGFVNIIGNPNVGKSTLMNSLVGEKLSIITSKAQTTRHRILGIVNGEDFQLVLSDTPGIIKPNYKLQASMMDFVKTAIDDADIIVYMIEAGESTLKDDDLYNKIKSSNIPILLIINKIDLSNQQNIEEQVEKWKDILPYWDVWPLIFPFDLAKNGFYGINLHYLPPNARIDLMLRLIKAQGKSGNLTDNYKLRLSYDIITNYPPAKPCIKRYLFSNVQGKGLFGIKGEDWSYAAALPLQKFRGASSDTVWKQSATMY